MIFLGIFWAILSLVIPIAIIVWVIKLIARAFGVGGNKTTRELTDRDVVITLLGIGAGLTGLIAGFQLPELIYDSPTDEQSFPLYLVLGIVFLLVGTALRETVGKMIMGLGIVFLVVALPTIFTEVGGIGIFAVVLAAFVALIFAAIRFSKKGGRHEV